MASCVTTQDIQDWQEARHPPVRVGAHLLPSLLGHLSLVVRVAFIPQKHSLHVGRGVLQTPINHPSQLPVRSTAEMTRKSATGRRCQLTSPPGGA